MAKFNSYLAFAISTIRENLDMAKKCMETPKSSNGDSCYGMPALILLSSAIDIIGTCYFWDFVVTEKILTNCDKHHVKDHFKTFYELFVKNKGYQQTEEDFIKHIYLGLRNPATHNGVIKNNHYITKVKSKNNAFIELNDNMYIIYLHSLYRCVENAYNTLIEEIGYNKNVEKNEISTTGQSETNINEQVQKSKLKTLVRYVEDS